MAETFLGVIQRAAQGEAQSVALVVCVYLLLMCGYSVFHQIRTRQWPAAEGKLLSIGVKKLGATVWVVSDQQYVGSALYEYRVAGTRYEGSKISPWVMTASHNMRSLLRWQMKGVAVGANGVVRVYYNPNKPQKSILIRPGLVGLLITQAIGILPLVWYVVKYGM